MWETGMQAGQETWLIHGIYHGLFWTAVAAVLIGAVVLILHLVESHDRKRHLR